MNRPRQALWWPALFAAAQIAVLPLPAQDSNRFSTPARPPAVPTNLMPPAPQARSPVYYFRQLLAMTPAELANHLTNVSPAIRGRILAKVREYRGLDPNERELRLDATELQWYLLPLLREPPADRASRLAQVPDNLRDLVAARLDQWDALSPESRQEFLDNEGALQYFMHVDSTNAAPAPAPSGGPGAAAQARWQALSAEERQRITAQFDQFFELTPEEKQRTLKTLSDPERAEMEKTLQSFDKLPLPQRRECIRAFTTFAGMSPAERAKFLKNAERWSQLPPKERQAWRDLVAQVPMWPPMPATFVMPPKPPTPHRPSSAPRVQPLVATNHN